MSSVEFLKIGNRYTKSTTLRRKATQLRRFKCHFGITPFMCSIVWTEIKDKAPANSRPKHLLWSLFFLKQYSVEHVRTSVLKADEKTVRKHTWIFVKLLSEMKMVQPIYS